MRISKVLFALMLGLASMSASAVTTVFAPTDGDVNFLFGDLNGGILAMFDDDDTGYAGTILGGTALNIPVPSIVGISGPNGNGDHIATNENLFTLTLTDSDQFILGMNFGSGWLAPILVSEVGANAYALFFNNGGSVVSVDVQAVTPDIMPPVPVPAAVWLFGSGLLGMIAIARRKAV